MPADARSVVLRAFEALLPAEKLSVADYALQHRWLANEGGGYIGRWRHDMVPYLVGPMQALTSLDYRTVAVVGPGQSAKTSIAENWLLRNIAVDPADTLWYMQTDAAVAAYVKGRIDPMIDSHREMKDRLGLRPVDDSLHFKRFRGCKVEWLSANRSNLINKSSPRIIADEIDAYPQSLGDVKALLDVRRQAFGEGSMLLMLSHPDLATGLRPERDWQSGIMAIYADSDRRRWYWPCPSCNGYSSPVPGAERFMALDYPADAPLDEIEAATRLRCPCCGTLIEDAQRREMNLRGLWVGEGQDIGVDGRIDGDLVPRKTAGFWIVGPMSPFVLGGIGGLARARVKAERDFASGGEEETIRQVVVKQWGIPYTPLRDVGTMAAETLAERAEYELKLGQVPEPVRFLTASVDVQGAYFDVLVRGWGQDGESWIVDTFKIATAAPDLGGERPLSPASRAEDWDLLIDRVLTRRWPLAADPTRGMACRGVGFDTGGLPGVTVQAYAAWRRWRVAGLVRNQGKLDGRDVWSVLPLKGGNQPNAARLQVVYPETARKNSKIRADGGMPLGLFNASAFKDALAGQLQRGDPGPRYVHFPAALKAQQPNEPHLWFEQLCAEQRRKDGRWEKIDPRARNEALDLMVMAHALAHAQGLERIRWDKPPPWAAPQAANPLVAAMEIRSEAPRAAPEANAVRVSPAASSQRSVASRLA